MKQSIIRISVLATASIVFLIMCKSPVSNKDTSADLKQYLEEMTIVQLQQGYREGKFTISQIVTDYLARIEAIDIKGPGLNSIICINPDAMQIARELDLELKAGK